MQAEQAEKKSEAATESRRDRVRRLLLAPLERDGFRKSAKVKAEDHQRTLDRIADAVGHMSDDGLETLRQMLRTKGQGAEKDIWPSLATVLGIAELVEPRPVEELPALVRWFRSVEGPRAEAEGTLVETWLWFQRHKRPPLHERRVLLERAQENRRRRTLTLERASRGRASEADLAWVRWYDDLEARCREIVRRGREEAA